MMLGNGWHHRYAATLEDGNQTPPMPAPKMHRRQPNGDEGWQSGMSSAKHVGHVGRVTMLQ